MIKRVKHSPASNNLSLPWWVSGSVQLESEQENTSHFSERTCQPETAFHVANSFGIFCMSISPSHRQVVLASGNWDWMLRCVLASEPRQWDSSGCFLTFQLAETRIWLPGLEVVRKSFLQRQPGDWLCAFAGTDSYIWESCYLKWLGGRRHHHGYHQSLVSPCHRGSHFLSHCSPHALKLTVTI